MDYITEAAQRYKSRCISIVLFTCTTLILLNSMLHTRMYPDRQNVLRGWHDDKKVWSGKLLRVSNNTWNIFQKPPMMLKNMYM